METKPWERLLSWVLTIVMVIQMIPVQAFAAETDEHAGHDHVDTQIETVIPSDETTEGDNVVETTPTVEPEEESKPADTATPEPTVEPTVAPTEEPVPTTEPTAEPTVAPTEEPVVEEDNSADNVAKVQQMIDDYMDKYGLTVGMSDEEITNAVFVATSDPRPDYEAIVIEAEKLTELDCDYILETYGEKIAVTGKFYNTIVRMNNPVTIETFTVLDNVTIVDTKGNGTLSGDAYTAYATSKGMFGGTDSNTITVTNTSKTDTIVLSFNAYGSGIGNGDAVKVNGTSLSNTTTKAIEIVLAPNSSFTVVVEAWGTSSGRNTTVKLSGFSKRVVRYKFQIGTNYYETLDEAIKAAVSGNTIVQIDDYTVPAGDYTIPSDVTLLIPYDAANTVRTTSPVCIGDAYTNPSVYRTLTMASGANIIVNGAISVGGQQSSKQLYNGCVSGPYGQIAMNSGSNITVENGGNLYAWGYITGSGSVEAKDGATIYEDFQLTDWRGGQATGTIANDDNINVFPFSQYHVQNIEVPLTIHAGAREYGYMSVNVTFVGVQEAPIPFIGGSDDDAMFKLSSGYVVKDYIEGTGRLSIKSYGDFSISSVTMSMTLALGQKFTIKSSDYVLPINGNMTVDIVSGKITMSQDVVMLPGSEMYIREGATCTLLDGSDIYIYDLDAWPSGMAYNIANSGWCASSNYRYRPLPYAPSGIGTTGREKDALIQVDGTIDASAGAVYATTGGANVYTETGNGTILLTEGTETETYQIIQNNTDVSTTAIAITPVKLKNADSSFKDTGSATYKYYNGEWHTSSCGGVYAEVEGTKVLPTCKDTGSVVKKCSCGYPEYTEEIPTTSHTEVVDAAVAPTCEGTGLTEGKHCSVCGTVTVAQQTVPALNHTETTRKENETSHSCTTDEAYDLITYCSSCGKTIKNEKVIVNKASHTLAFPEVVEFVQATCYAEGYTTTVTKCTKCDYSTTETIKTEKLAHTSNEDNRVVISETPSTCITAGSRTTAIKCSVTECGIVIDGTEKTETLALAAHTYGEPVTEIVQPTCTEDGYEKTIKTCTVDGCGHQEVTTVTTGYKATGHDSATWITAKDATCTEDGYEGHFACSKCGTAVNFDEDEIEITVIPAKNHVGTESHQKTVVEKAPTCEEDGLHIEQIVCECGEVLSTTKVTDTKLGHEWDNGTVKTEPKCEETGEMIYTCVRGCTKTEIIPATGHQNLKEAVEENRVEPKCGVEGSYDMVEYCGDCNKAVSTQHFTIEALEHVYDNGVVTTDPTCTTDGVKTFTCTNTGCGNSYTEPVSKTNHANKHDVEAQAPTCEKTGLTAGVYCPDCETWLEAQETVPVRQHLYDEGVQTVDPGCETEGAITYSCTYDDCDYSYTVTVDALTHDVVIDKAVAATCTETGLTEGKHCDRCSKVLVAQTETPVLGHQWTGWVVTTAPTCTEEGVETRTCQHENCEITETQQVNKTGHSLETVGTVTTYPTCTTDGVRTYYCQNTNNGNPCDYSETTVEPRLGHDYEPVVTEPTCTAQGYTTYTCKNDPAHTYVSDYTAAKNHNMDEGTVTTLPTCETEGVKTFYCQNTSNGVKCDHTTTETVAVLTHDWTEWTTETAANCTTEGKEARSCKRTDCGETEENTLPALGHTLPENWTVVTAPTCTETGIEEKVCTRTSCDKKGEYRLEQTIKALDHDYVVSVVEPTCTAEGYTKTTCSRCDYEEITDKKAALDHDMPEEWTVVTEPTCTTEGLQEKVCTRENCDKQGDYRLEEVISTVDHNWDEGVVTTQPTCKDEGVKTFTCSFKDCSDKTKTETIEKAAHTWVDDIRVEPTCTSAGFGYRWCSVCYEDAGRIDLEALGHDWVDVQTKEPTCTETGISAGYQECSRCDATQSTGDDTGIIPALGHDWTDWETVIPAGCETEGSAKRTCKRTDCGATETIILPVTDHVWSDWTETTAPKCGVAGEAERSCDNGCGNTETKVLDALEHDWTEWTTKTAANCTTEGKETRSCKRTDCGETEENTLPALGHTLPENWTVVTAPTCTETGIEEKVCTRTGCDKQGEYRLEQTIKALDHDYVVSVVEPTCTAEGYTKTTCSRCDYEEITDKKAALGHDMPEEWTVTKEVTCTADGEQEKVCTRENCDKQGEYKLTETIKSEGHKYELLETTIKPTCTERGLDTYECSVCHSKKTETTDALTHDYDTVVTDPTCEKDGFTTYTCTRDNCGHSYVDNYVEKLNHKWNEGEVVTEPTCETDGLKVYTCSNDSTHTYDEIIYKLNHAPLEAVRENEVDSTCYAEGSYDEVIYCGNENCDKENNELSRETKEIEKKAHTEAEAVEENRVEATCEKDGSYDVVIYCSVEECKAEISRKTETIGKLNHAPLEAVRENEVDSTCYAEGSYDEVIYCGNENCDKENNELSRETKEIEKKAHTEAEAVEENRVEATCEKDGSYDVVIYCSVEECKAEISRETKVIEATGHKPNIPAATCTVDKVCTAEGCGEILEKATGHNTVVDAAVKPTCTEAGLTAGTHCDKCGEVFIEQTVRPATNHANKYDVAETAPTCTATGLTAGVYCPDCETWQEEQETIPVIPHTEEAVKGYPATCTGEGREDGIKCSVCGETLVAQKTIPAKGHNPVTEKRIEATCTEAGYTETTYCDRCGMVSKPKVEIPAKGHTKAVDPAVAPKCEEPGLKAGEHCSVCGEVLKAQEEIPATGHNYDSGVVTTEPTCTEEGVKTYTCYNDKTHTYTEPVEALGHTEAEIPAVAPKCEEVGYTAGVKCSVCEEVLVEPEEVEATGHSWNTGRITKDPTCEEEGERTYTCTTCRDEKVEAEAALGHILETVPARKPTYTEDGWHEYERCVRDTELCQYNTREVIPALGEPSIENFDEFIENLAILENIANTYVTTLYPGKDPAMLVIKYIRTGVDRYNSGSWNIMAGYEDADFAKYVADTEKAYNLALEDGAELMKVTGLKDIKHFSLPNGEKADIGHVFGTMDISYTNKTSINHHDVAGWAGDSVDLISVVDQYGFTSTELEELIEEVKTKYFLKDGDQLWAENGEESKEGSFGQLDVDGDLDGYYVMQQLLNREYENGTLTDIFANYMTPSLTKEQRAEYFLKNRLGGVTSRSDIRDAVFAEYTANGVVATLEGTREFNTSDISDLRKAVCYTFADYLCKFAGDWVEIEDNNYYTVFSTEKTTLVSGITQEINKATTADGKQVVYYLATGDITSPYISVHANYNANADNLYWDAENSQYEGWRMDRVRDQANYVQNKYGNPESEHYVPNYKVITAINGAGFNMSTGEPGGLMVINGVEYQAPNANGFFGILKDGTPVIGTTEEYNTIYKGQVQEGIAAFGSTLVKDGKISVSASGTYYTDRASRTAIGITKTGKVVFLVVDGRQEPVSCGGSMQEIAQMMLEAGCVTAVNLDGGGSTTYVARQPGSEELTVVSKPSDGYERSVSTSLYMVSVAPSETEFDHAIVESDYNYLTIGSTAQLTAKAVSATNNPVEMPEGAEWKVSDEAIGTISADGVFTAKANGTVTVHLMLDSQSIGSRVLNVVVPNNIYFERDALNAIYGQAITLPVKGIYNGKSVSTNINDFVLTPAVEGSGTVSGFEFTGNETSGLKKIVVNAALAKAPECTATITLSMFREDEASFDFDNATGGDRQLAWERVISNSVEESVGVYRAVDTNEDMVTSYTFAIDMSKIDIPPQLADLVYMLPGADAADASAWNFLLQLAERISVLTTVEPVLYFDKNMDVDLEGLSVSNEYFLLNETNPYTFDPEENALTLHLTWKDQTQAIDPATANPLCILTGVKLTPKDGTWDNNEKINVVNTGSIGYRIYLRANALYSFAQKPENQAIYGLYPFVNPDLESEKGGYFESVYKEFRDEYTLINSDKSGWFHESTGYAYYVNGMKLTGINKIDGYYYDMGSDGINIGQTKYTGLVDIDGVNHYSRNGVLTSGWVNIGEDKYCFDENGAGYDGKHVIDGIEMEFDNGLMTGGQTGFVTKAEGVYYYKDGEMQFGWQTIDGNLYHFNVETGIMVRSESHYAPDQESASKKAYYDFAEDGKVICSYFNPAGYYYWGGIPRYDSWVKEGSDMEEDSWYRTNSAGHFVKDTSGNAPQYTIGDKTYTVVRIHIDGHYYTFDNDTGKLIEGDFDEENGQLYYYWAGMPYSNGWFEVQGEDALYTYYAYADGHLATGVAVIDGRDYVFDEQGRLISGERPEEPEDPVIPEEPEYEGIQAMYRMYNPYTYEHFYTGSKVERDNLVKVGWNYEGIGFYAPIKSDKPMYRLFNPYTDDHHYTASQKEVDILVEGGWNYEGIGWYSAEGMEGAQPQYRLFNKYLLSGSHHYTGSMTERKLLEDAGWIYEGIGFWGAAKPE